MEGSGLMGAGIGAGGGSGGDNMIQRLQKALDLEETDRDTLHLLTFLFMQFLAQPHHSSANDDNSGGKMTETVLRHLAALMGYSVVDNNFCVGPAKLRSSPVFNSFVGNLPQVLDHNFQMAAQIISMIIPLLQFCPAVLRTPELRQPTYSLWMLQPTIRKAWLTSVLTIFYKFDCEESYLKSQVQSLILITLNTLDRHFHRCRMDQTTAVTTAPLQYSRDMSQGSLGGDDDGGGCDRGSSAAGPAAGDASPPTCVVTIPRVTVTSHSTLPDVQLTPSGPTFSSPAAPPAPAPVAAVSVMQEQTYRHGDAGTDTEAVKEVWYDASAYDLQPSAEMVCPGSVTKREVATVQYAVASAVDPELHHAEPATAVTSVMASQIQAFDDSFTVKIHNTEFAYDDDSGLQRLSEKALEGLRSRFSVPDEAHPTSHHQQQFSVSNTASPTSTLSCHDEPSSQGVVQLNQQDNNNVCDVVNLSRDIAARRIQSHAQFSSSTPKSSGSSQRSSTSYWLSSSTSTDSSSDFNVSRAANKLAFEICIEEDPESWAASDESKNASIDKGETPVTAKHFADSAAIGGTEAGYFSEESGIEATLCSSVEPDASSLETPKIYQVRVSQVIPRFENVHNTITKCEVEEILHISGIKENDQKPEKKSSNIKTGDQIPPLRSGDSFVFPTPIKSTADHGLPTAQRSTMSSEESKDSNLQSSSLSHGLQLNTACSPSSPLSMMDLITVGSPVAIDCSTSSPSIDLPSPKLELPTPERLLDGREAGMDRTQEPRSIVDRVWEAFGGWNNENKNDDQFGELQQVLSDGMSSGSSLGPHRSRDGASLSSQTSPQDPCTTISNTSHKAQPKSAGSQSGKAKSMTTYRAAAAGKQTDSSKQDTFIASVKDALSLIECVGAKEAGSGVVTKSPRGVIQTRQGSIPTSSGLTKCSTVTAPANSGGRALDATISVTVSGDQVVSKEVGNREGSKTSDADSSSSGPPPSSMKQSSLRVGDDCMVHRCLECGECIEEFSNEDLGMCIIILSTFVHRKPALAAPLLPRMLQAVARVSGSELFSWQYSTGVHLPGSCTSIGGQFLRCVLHQLAPNQIFYQIFITKVEESKRVKLFRTLAQALMDFNELNSSAPVQSLLENLNERKELPVETLTTAVANLACYMECVHQDAAASFSSALVPHFETFLRKLALTFHILEDVDPLLKLLCAIFRIQGVVAHKSILEPVSKAVVFGLRKAPVKYSLVADLCFLCSRCFPRERDKLFLARMMALELVQALKFKVTLPDSNLVLLVQLILQDNGGSLGPNPVLADLKVADHNSSLLAECIKGSYLSDVIDFIADVHTLTKIKSGLNQDTIGGLLKAGLSQYLALEISRGSSRDIRFFNKYLPWLNSPPTTVQQGPKEFLECVGHIRLLSWLLVGALMYTCHQPSATPGCMPVPPDASCHIADHIQVILAGFPEQSKASVVNMSSLFLAFILSQVWTVYLEQNAGIPGTDVYNSTCALLTDFWAKVTPAILQLVSHSKVETDTLQLGEMVSLHFLSLLEALQQCGSTVLSRLMPLWAPLLHSPHHVKLPDQLAVRLQACQDAIPTLPPPTAEGSDPQLNSSPLTSSTTLPSLLTWLNRLQFRMGQIELQSSAATQFYSM